MKTLPLFAACVLLSGCATLTQTPSSARLRQMEEGARRQEEDAPRHARDEAIRARARDYEKRGYDREQAIALALADAHKPTKP